ncbi:MAG: ABATE domain-containing protein [Acidobacteria bacterium]|nr:ABATE domain-containing protein [Acidobacteriota bacterium]MBI3661837.1 ABATE domain-containing protein [Acidobacteriota bacterium]
MAVERQFELTGGRLCLDFANTVDNRPAPNRQDYLSAYSDLVAWSRQTRILRDAEANQLRREASRRPEEAEAALMQARTLRETIYCIFSAVASGSRPKAAELDALNSTLPAFLANSRVVPSQRGFALQCTAGSSTLDRMLWAVSRSTFDLLLRGDLQRVRECAAENCGWLFVDNTKNHRRRWCDTRTCGNRDKVRRFRQRWKKK